MKVSFHVGKDGEPSGYLILCPACKTPHFFASGPHGWRFNWDMERPTFHPSLRIERKDGSQCHINVTNGEVHFDTDCTHELAGQTVLLEDVPW